MNAGSSTADVVRAAGTDRRGSSRASSASAAELFAQFGEALIQTFLLGESIMRGGLLLFSLTLLMRLLTLLMTRSVWMTMTLMVMARRPILPTLGRGRNKSRTHRRQRARMGTVSLDDARRGDHRGGRRRRGSSAGGGGGRRCTVGGGGTASKAAWRAATADVADRRGNLLRLGGTTTIIIMNVRTTAISNVQRRGPSAAADAWRIMNRTTTP